MTYDDDTRLTNKQHQNLWIRLSYHVVTKQSIINTYKAPRGVFNLRHSRIVVLSVSWHQFPISVFQLMRRKLAI